MISQYFPQLDKRSVQRLLRGGLRIELHETSLLHAASRLTQLGILKTDELHYVRCTNPADGDFPDDILYESCPGQLSLALPEHVLRNGHPVYQCPDCGRIVEYPGVDKAVFRSWQTQLRPEMLADYERLAIDALSLVGHNTDRRRVGKNTTLTALELLTGDPTTLQQAAARSMPPDSSASQPYRHRQRGDLADISQGLLNAFPTKPLLAHMLRFELDLELDAIALGDNLTEVVNRVVLMAEQEGWLSQLIEAARHANQGNRQLQKL